jgi:ubiquinone/menaquinone biosynthesis C-methylase UbiE
MTASHPRWSEVGGNAAEIYQERLVPSMFAPWASTLVDLADVEPGKRVLDVACGPGVVTRQAASRAGVDGRVVGLDINAAMLAVARSLPAVEGAAIEWIEASALDMPLPDASFEIVLCQQGLQQFPDRPAALREMRRVLKPGGRLALGVWSRLEENPAMAALVAALAAHVGTMAADNRKAPFALGDASVLRDLIEQALFREIDARTLVKTACFPSVDEFVSAQLAATPLSTLGAFTSEAEDAVRADVRARLGSYLNEDGLRVPMSAHLILARG